MLSSAWPARHTRGRSARCHWHRPAIDRRRAEAVRHRSSLFAVVHCLPPGRRLSAQELRGVSQDRALSNGLDVLSDPNVAWHGLSGLWPQRSLTRSLPRPCSISNCICIAPHGGTRTSALVGLDATLVLCTMVASTALLPFTAPLFAYALVGPALVLSPLVLGLKLLAILAGSALVGFAMRSIVGVAAIERQNERIEGLNILVLFVFVTAVMGKRRRPLSRRADDHNWPRRACLRCFLRSACADDPHLRIRGPKPGSYAWVHGLATQRGADAGGDGRDLARPHLAIFRLLLFPSICRRFSSFSLSRAFFSATPPTAPADRRCRAGSDTAIRSPPIACAAARLSRS